MLVGNYCTKRVGTIATRLITSEQVQSFQFGPKIKAKLIATCWRRLGGCKRFPESLAHPFKSNMVTIFIHLLRKNMQGLTRTQIGGKRKATTTTQYP